MLDELKQRFPHPDVRFYQKDQLLMIELNNRYGSATLTDHGGTLLSYIPAGGDEVIWVSETAVYDGGKPVRGGVPICWPWFGPYDSQALGADPSDAAKKGHGVARYEFWQLSSVLSVGDATEVVLQLEPNDSIRKAWPLPFELKLIVTLGEKLTMELVGKNCSDRDWVVSEAFHTYFRVGQAEGLAIEGLKKTSYIDKGREGQRFTQEGPLHLELPMERIYLDQQGAVVLDDSANHRRIMMEKVNSASTVVWNPGPEGARGFADMPDDQYAHMVCVEAGNALDNAYPLRAGESHSMGMVIAAE